jgi:anti-anti-sigma factor
LIAYIWYNALQAFAGKFCARFVILACAGMTVYYFQTKDLESSMDTGGIMNFSEIDNTLHCLFSGRLDWTVCSEIERDLLQRVSNFKDSRGNVQLTFDLADVVYVSSAFLRICLICCKTIGKHGFSITNTSEDIHNVFRISGFSEIMDVSPARRASEMA